MKILTLVKPFTCLLLFLFTAGSEVGCQNSPKDGRDELLDQISMMRMRLPDYKSYADATLTDVFTADDLIRATHLTANYLKTAYFERTPPGKFRERELPRVVQNAPSYTLTALDYDGDGHKDRLICGSISRAKLRSGKSGANYGLLLRGDGNGRFSVVPQQQSGFRLLGGNNWLFGINQQPLRVYQVSKL